MNKKDSTSDTVKVGVVGLVGLLILGSIIGSIELSAFLERIANTPNVADLEKIAYLALACIVAVLGLAIGVGAAVVALKIMWTIAKSFILPDVKKTDREN